MPRKSADALAGEAFRALNAPKPPPPPKPPRELSPRAKQIWNDIVTSKPPTYFDPANAILLAQFVTAAATADIVEVEMQKLDPTDLTQRRRWAQLQIMSCRLTSTMLLMAKSLRLLPGRTEPMPSNARFGNRNAAGLRGSAPQPWASIGPNGESIPLWERHR